MGLVIDLLPRDPRIASDQRRCAGDEHRSTVDDPRGAARARHQGRL